jgi:hypothetical protein
MDKKKVESLYQKGVNIEMGLIPFTIHPKMKAPIFKASDSLCPRLAYLKGMRRHLLPEESLDLRRKFDVGNIFHKMADDGIDKVLWDMDGEAVRISPFRLRCFSDIFVGDTPDCVSGTPDHIILFPLKKQILLVDQKSANDYSFGKASRAAHASSHHSVQVGTYMDGLMNSPLAGLVSQATSMICYMSKESVTISMKNCAPGYTTAAREYWLSVSHAMQTEALPPALPREDWACKYCSFFNGRGECEVLQTLEDFDDFIAATKEGDDVEEPAAE